MECGSERSRGVEGYGVWGAEAGVGEGGMEDGSLGKRVELLLFCPFSGDRYLGLESSMAESRLPVPDPGG